MATTAQEGNTVQVHYTGRLHDGQIFDSSEGRQPLEFRLGDRNMIPGFEAAVYGMAAGDKKTTEIPCEEAYGPASEDMFVRIPWEEVPEEISPSQGQQLTLTSQNGQQVPAVVTEVTEEYITLDANHPLAGKDLIFDITLVSIS